MPFFEIDDRGITTQLSRLACGIAPCGGTVVYANSTTAAQELYFRYHNGEYQLKRDLWLPGEHNPYKNVIHETATFLRHS